MTTSTGNVTKPNFFTDNFERLCNYMERETVGTQLTIYGASGLMLLVAFVKRRPTYLVRPFKKPSHIPEKLINERVMHTGIIRDIQQQNQDTLLMINHRPLIPFFASKDRVLPVKLPGVRVNGNGMSWLQTCIVGRQATFIPLAKRRDDYVVGQLCLVHPPRGKRLLDISETLLKLRFARFAADDNGLAVKKNEKYYKHLKKVEASSSSKEAWLQWLVTYPWIWSSLRDAQAKVLPKHALLPELVR